MLTRQLSSHQTTHATHIEVGKCSQHHFLRVHCLFTQSERTQRWRLLKASQQLHRAHYTIHHFIFIS